jgi:asparagine synthase (glutamine-hydrolysing)
MCGIVGLIKKGHGSPTGTISRMLSIIQHRGPDDTGTFVENTGNANWLGLGHNRLSILDLTSRGHQPMVSPDDRYVLVYNEEVYNYFEIARDLGNDAVLDISSGDTAVVLAALIKWGPTALKHFNGMWALAFYDRAQKARYSYPATGRA